LLDEEHILTFSRDVSERVKADKELERARKELEDNVEEQSRELKMKSQNLEETNITLRVLLGMRERDKRELERSVMFNVKQLGRTLLREVEEQRPE